MDGSFKLLYRTMQGFLLPGSEAGGDAQNQIKNAVAAIRRKMVNGYRDFAG